MPRRTTRPCQHQATWAWQVIVCVLAVLAACSPSTSAATADATETDVLVDADLDGVVDAQVDPDAMGEVADDSADADSSANDSGVAADGVAIPFECTGTAVYPPEGTTLLLDVGPLVPNPVFTCGNAPPPQPVAVGCSTCDCPLPYSCYCNGECAWLRTPDLKKPHFNSKAVWTGKWVVSVTYDDVYLGPGGEYNHAYYLRAERWDPKSGKGFEEIPLGELVFHYPIFDVVSAAGKVVISSYDIQVLAIYDPESNTVADWNASKTVQYGDNASTGKLIARLEHDGSNGFSPTGRLRLYDPVAGTWKEVPFPAALVPSDGFFASSRVLANGKAVFAYDAVSGVKPFPDGTFAKDVGHVLKYDLASGTWSDVGVVPAKWRSWHLHSAVVDDLGAILIVRDPGDSVARLANGVLTDAPLPAQLALTFAARFTGQRTPCGVVYGYAAWWSAGPVQPAHARTTLIRDNLTADPLPNWGWPKDGEASPLGGSCVLTDTELLILGGMDDAGAHRDGYRYPLSEICK